MSPAVRWSARSSLERTACAAVLLSALEKLHQVCLDMDGEREAERPSEHEYQNAMRIAAQAIALVKGGSAA